MPERAQPSPFLAGAVRPRLPALAAAGLATWLLAGTALAAPDPLSEANRLLQGGDLAGARTQLQQAVQKDPRNGTAHYRLALVDMRLGDPAAAEREADLARRAGYDTHAATALLLQAYLSEGKFRELLTDFPAAGPGADQPADLRATVLVARGLAQISLDQLPAAGQTLDEAQKLAPKATEPLLAQERLALARHDTAEAQRKVDAVLALEPDSTPALDQKAYLLTQAGQGGPALEVLNGVLAKHPDDGNARLQRAGLLLAAGKDDQARIDVTGVLATAPGNAQALFYRAVLLARAKDWKGSDADLARLAPVIARFPGAYFVQAVVKQQLGQLEQARDAAARFASRNPDNQQAARLLAGIDLQMHRPDLAVGTLTRFVPANADPAAAAATGQDGAARSRAGQDSPQVAEPATYQLLGRAYAAQGRMDLSTAVLRHALAKGGDNDAGVMNQLAMSYLTMGDPRRAASSLQDSLHARPDQPDAEQVLALAALEGGNVAEAQGALDRLRAQHASAESIGNLAGLIAMARLDFPAARAAFEGVLHDAPGSVPAHVNLAHLDELENKPDAVRADLAAVLDKDPANPQVLPLLTAQLLATKRFDEAARVLAAAHAARPDDQQITAALADAQVRAGQPQAALALTDGSSGHASSLGMVTARAEAQLALHQDDAARQTYRDYVASNPRALPARLTLIRMMMAGQDYAGARSMVSDGLNLTPADPQLLGSAVGVAFKAQGFDPAMARARELAADPTHQPAALALPGDLYMLASRPSEAAEAYGVALRQAPSSVLAIQRSRALDAAGKGEQATAALRDWLQQHPDDTDALTMLSSLDIVQHRLDDAAPLLQHLVALHSTDVTALNNLAWVQQQRGKPDALGLAQRAYLLSPGPQTADTLGFILATGGQAGSAVPLLQVAHERSPNDPAVAYHLAVALAGSGQKAAAVQLLGPVAGGAATFDEKPAAQKLLSDLQRAG